MKKIIKTLCLLLITLGSIHSVKAQSIAHKDSLNILVKTYYDLNLKVFQSDSTPLDIENIFNLFTKDFTYIHPKYGGLYIREVLYKGYLRNQKNGRYDGDITKIKIINRIVGLNSVVVSRRYFTKKEGEGELKMTLFEFKEGKISKIFEYW